MNLFESRAVNSDIFGYFCTWVTQFRGRTLEQQASDVPQGRDFLTEENLFRSGGLADLFPAARQDLWLVLDDGWDVGYGLHMGKNREQFGSLIVSEERFPSVAGMAPAERFARLRECVCEYGWKNLGLWVSSGAKGENPGQFLSPPAREEYWRERLRWSREAGISYWKVDWGWFERDLEFRRQLFEWSREEAPDLLLEHAGCVPPLSGMDLNCPEEGSGRFLDWYWSGYNAKDLRIFESARWLELLECSDVFRTYDVTLSLSVPTTLDRVAGMLSLANKNKYQGKAFLNSEDELYTGAALNCCLGVMRSAMCSVTDEQTADPHRSFKRITEVNRAVNWQKYFAPPVPAGEGELNVSEEVLFDSHDFSDGTFQGGFGPKIFRQGANAVISRACPLPKIKYCEARKPFVVAGRSPNGNTAVATLPRVKGQADVYIPKASVTMQMPDTSAACGVFGEYESLTLVFPDNINLCEKTVWAQDLADIHAQNITEAVQIDGKSLTLPGTLVHTLGTKVNPAGDISHPGLVLTLKP